MTPLIDSAACEIIPVLDLMHGQIVRGIAGRRESYQPIQSQLLDSARPLEVANTFQAQLGLERVYLADLDAIQHDQPDWDTLDALVAAGHRLLVDAGPRNTDRAVQLIEHRVDSVVAGLETLDRPELIAELVEAVGNRQLVLSLDLKNGQPMIDAGTWPDPTPLGLATMAVDMGIQRMIVLDLAGVGTQ
ncbi:MAG: HisA/HisF-related TIM barrel protein, partial [Planctomycetaceae bacterium]